MNKIAIIGASGHGKVIADIARLNGYKGIVFLDDDKSKQQCGGYPVIGNSAMAIDLAPNYDLIIGIGNAKIRERIQTDLEHQGIKLSTLIHPSAVVAENVTIGAGTVVMAGAVINPETSIGEGCIINTCSSVDHDCVLDNYVHVSVGSHLAGTVHIGKSTWIGIGAVISNNLTVAGECVIGAGAVVVHDIDHSGTYIGVPATEYIK